MLDRSVGVSRAASLISLTSPTLRERNGSSTGESTPTQTFRRSFPLSNFCRSFTTILRLLSGALIDATKGKMGGQRNRGLSVRKRAELTLN